MDEIDNIILHSLRHIGCTFDEDADQPAAAADATTPLSLADLSPAILLPCVVRCLQLIQPQHATTAGLPVSMPAGMAQRFAATTALAEACMASGFRGDIGYQTFLYSNVAEVRRVLMYLIERLPKETTSTTINDAATADSSSTSALLSLERRVAASVRQQLDAAWTPEYCKKMGIVRLAGGSSINAQTPNLALQSSAHAFRPHRLHIAHPTRTDAHPALRDYWSKRSPTLFQQTHAAHLCASLLHRNDVDRLAVDDATLEQRFERFLRMKRDLDRRQPVTVRTGTASSGVAAGANTTTTTAANANVKSVQQLKLHNVHIPNADDIVSMPEISARDTLAFDVEKLRQSLDADTGRRSQISDELARVRSERAAATLALKELSGERKVLERTQILLENPEVNVQKMGEVLAATEARMQQLAKQWQAHRGEMMAELERAQQAGVDSPCRQLLDQLQATRDRRTDVSAQLATKAALHAKLLGDLQKFAQLTASRDDYTSRILEIIGNIRKQKADIAKVLLDTRGLQKEINNVSGQLDRQFVVTDDLMFKNAKRDEHAKAAYKHLATLHSDCGELVRLVEETGAIVREVRELEDQIETEKSRNVAANLQRITNDLQLVVQEGRELAARVEAGNVAVAASEKQSSPQRGDRVVDRQQ